MSVQEAEGHEKEPSPRHRLKAVAAGTLALITLALLVPFAFRGVYFVEPPHEGYVACYVGRSTSLSILFNDYGRWPWLNASGTIMSVATDNPELVVTSFSIAPLYLNKPCRRWVIRMEVTPLSPGEHHLTALTIARGGSTRALPIGRVLFDARSPGQDRQQLVDLSTLVLLFYAVPYRHGHYDGEVWLGSRAVDVSLVCPGLPEDVILEFDPVRFDGRGAYLRVQLKSEASDGHLRRRVLLVRPWLAVSSEEGDTLEPGPLYIIDWPS